MLEGWFMPEAQRQDDETEFETLLEREVKKAMAIGFAEGKKHAQETIAGSFRDHAMLTEWCRKHNHMFIITARGIEITSRAAAEYVRSLKFVKGDDVPKQDRR